MRENYRRTGLGVAATIFRSAAVCGAPAAAPSREPRYWDHFTDLADSACCGWSFGHSRGPVVVSKCGAPLPQLDAVRVARFVHSLASVQDQTLPGPLDRNLGGL